MNQKSKVLAPALITTLLALTACQPNQNTDLFERAASLETSDSQIVGGNVVSSNDLIVKSVAGVLLTSTNSARPGQITYDSTGTVILVTNLIAFTTAHTFTGQKIGREHMPDGSYIDHKVELRFGTNLQLSTGIPLSLEDFSDPSVFSSSYNGPDFVMIRIPGGSPYGIPPVSIWRTDPGEQPAAVPGQKLKIAGYGKHASDNDDLLLRSGEVMVTATDISKAKFQVPYNFRSLGQWVADSFLETDQTGTTAFCGGDSGGPLYQEILRQNRPVIRVVAFHVGKGNEPSTGYCKNSSYELRTDIFRDQMHAFHRRVKAGN